MGCGQGLRAWGLSTTAWMGLSSSPVLMGKDLKALLDSHLASKEEAEDHKGKLGPSCRRHMEAVTGLEIEMKTISDQHFRGVWRQEATTSK